jgi:hypothetical protein
MAEATLLEKNLIFMVRLRFDFAPFDLAPFDFAPFDFAQGG